MTRTLAIEERGDLFRRESIPQIRLKGQWLKVAGFHPGSRVQVTQLQSGVLELRVCSPVQVSAECLAVMGRIDDAMKPAA
ncbi:MAG TPA: SymE family type I addiction module toxin [Verrucomicrobiae bacterium]|jgi:hypothetical protein